MSGAALPESAFRDEERFVWGLCYRLTGSAADADDLVQETFARALAKPPARVDEPLRPWLVRVATNLGRDLLRRRKRQGYVGPWLPSPVEDDSPLMLVEPAPTEARYDLMESVSVAFLVAIEVLSPKQRAVLLLRDVFDYDVRETGAALGLSEANVKTTHHRARRAMDAYDADRRPPSLALALETRKVFESFLACLVQQDVAGIEALLADDARALHDGGGEFFAARVPVVGPTKIAKTYAKLAARADPRARFEMRSMNGLPALIANFPSATGGRAPRYVIQVAVAPNGLIRTLYAVVASRKLTAVA